MTPPPLGNIDRSGWKTIEPNTHWGRRYMDFVLHTTFQVPADWEADRAGGALPAAGRGGRLQPPGGAGLHRRRALRHLRPPSPGDPAARALRATAAAPAGPARLDRAARGSRTCAFDPGLFMRECCRRADRPADARLHRGRARGRWSIADKPGRQRAGQGPPAQRPGRGLQAPRHCASRWATASTPACPPAHAALRAGHRRGRPAAGRRASSPPATPTSTWPGCGRWARPGARPGAPSTPCCG